MNTKDIEAARKLIAQFEDRATGRHNSTFFPSRTEGTSQQDEEAERQLQIIRRMGAFDPEELRLAAIDPLAHQAVRMFAAGQIRIDEASAVIRGTYMRQAQTRAAIERARYGFDEVDFEAGSVEGFRAPRPRIYKEIRDHMGTLVSIERIQ